MRRILATLTVVGALLFSAGSAWADFDDGLAAYQRGDYATALQEWRLLAEQGYAVAQSDLGFMYREGEGVPQNDAEALKWYSLAKAQGSDAAAHNLDIIQKQMTPTQIDEAQKLAAEWWEEHNN